MYTFKQWRRLFHSVQNLQAHQQKLHCNLVTETVKVQFHNTYYKAHDFPRQRMIIMWKRLTTSAALGGMAECPEQILYEPNFLI